MITVLFGKFIGSDASKTVPTNTRPCYDSAIFNWTVLGLIFLHGLFILIPVAVRYVTHYGREFRYSR